MVNRKKDTLINKLMFNVLTMLFITSLIGNANAFSNSGDETWQYYRDITISNAGNALTNYPILINLIDSNFPLNARSEDLRFIDANGNELSHWIESWDYFGRNAKIWVNVKNIPASGSTNIRMYYGNPLATSVSNGTSVFEFFDDFNDGDYSKNPAWTLFAGSFTGASHFLESVSFTSDNILYVPSSIATEAAWEFKMRMDGIPFLTGPNPDIALVLISSATGGNIDSYVDSLAVGLNSQSVHIVYGTGNSRIAIVSAPWTPDMNWHTIKVTRNADNVWELFFDGVSKGTGIHGGHLTSSYLQAFVRPNPNNLKGEWDDIRIRKYASSEPTFTSISDEKSVNTVEIIMNPLNNKTIYENSLLQFNITATGSGSLTYSSPNLPSGATLDSSTGVFSWRPGAVNVDTDHSVSFTVSDGDGNTDSKTITITVKNMPDYSFVHMTDIHIGSAFNYIRHDTALDTFIQIVQTINGMDDQERPKFALVSGDVGDLAIDTNYEDYMEVLGGSSIPAYNVRGNHDYRGNVSGFNIVEPDHNISFEYHGIRYIGLDSGHDDYPDDIDDRNTPEGSGLTDEQMDWLNETGGNLLNIQKNNQKKIIFMHHPLMDDHQDASGGDGAPGGNDESIIHHRGDMINYSIRSNVELVLAGHTHEDMVFDASGVRVNNLAGAANPLFIQTRSATQNTPGLRMINVVNGEIIAQETTLLTNFFRNQNLGMASSDGPADLHLTSGGNHVGLDQNGQMEIQIPGVQHSGTGEHQTIVIPRSTGLGNHRFEVRANGAGKFNLTVYSFPAGDENGHAYSYREIPIGTHSTAYVDISGSDSDKILNVDFDGDGATDEQVLPDAERTYETETGQSGTNDPNPPDLNISEPALGQITFNDTITAAGTVTDESGIRYLKINGEDVVAGEDGSFSRIVALPVMGLNVINITAQDTAGNEVTALLKITRTIRTPPVPEVSTIILVSIGLIGMIYARKKIK